MKVLHLTLQKRWFDMILSGEKKEEYRENKHYWIRRLTSATHWPNCKEFDIVRFKNGYSKDAPEMDVECKDIKLADNGRPEWGFEERCFIISLGNILSTKNLN